MLKPLVALASRFCMLLSIAAIGTSWAWAVHKIAVIIPMEHQAMDDIVAGIKEHLPPSEYAISLHRAHGDLNILTNILNQIHYQKSDAVIAIGTTTSQMALSQLPEDLLVICSATSITPDSHRSNVYVVDDTADISAVLKKLPHLTYLGVCYSAQDKSILEFKELKKSLNGTKIVLEERMAHSMQDLPSAVSSFSSKTQAILLFKDHLTVSALPVFLQECQARKIPLIASDEASVQKGATLTFGVEEKQIGVLSAQVLKRAFDEVEQPIVATLTPFAKLYVNKQAIKKQSLWTIDEIANMGWDLSEVG